MASTVALSRRRASPKSSTFTPPIVRDHDIGALQVPMNDLTIMRMGQGVGDLNSIARHGLGRKLRAACHLVQGLSFNQLHDKIEAIIDAADLVNGADVGVVECRGGLRLLQAGGPCRDVPACPRPTP